MKAASALSVVTGLALTRDLHQALDALYPGINWPFGCMAVMRPTKGEDLTTSAAAKALLAQYPILHNVDVSTVPDWAEDEGTAWAQAEAWTFSEIRRLALPDELEVEPAPAPSFTPEDHR